MSYFVLHLYKSQSANIALQNFKIRSTLTSKREYIIINNNPINPFISTGSK